MDRKPEHGYGFYKTAAVTFSVEVGNVFKNAKRLLNISIRQRKSMYSLLFSRN